MTAYKQHELRGLAVTWSSHSCEQIDKMPVVDRKGRNGGEQTNKSRERINWSDQVVAVPCSV